MARAVKQEQTKQDALLELKQFQLSSLLEITQAINQNFSAEQLFSIFKFVLRTQLKIKKMALFVTDEIWSAPITYGVPPEAEEVDVHKYLIHLKEITDVDETFPGVFQLFQTIIPVVHKNKPLAFALIGQTELGKIELKDDLIPFVQTLLNIIIVAIENKKMGREQIQQQALKIELALAAQMQTMLIPDDLPQDKDIEMFASYLPHQQIGGDYYDYFKLNENEIAFCMADVSGKGIAAALLMSNFQANLSALVRITDSLTDLVNKLNEKVMESAQGEKFITLFIAKYNRMDHTLSFVNCGHNPPLLYTEGKTCLLEVGTTGLGMIDELGKVKEGKLKITSGSIFLSYTDGVVETENEGAESYGMERLTEFFNNNASTMKISEFNNSLIGNLVAFKGKMKFADDVTLLVCRFK